MIEIDKQILKHILALQKPSMVGVSGLGGAGKSTIAKAISDQTKIPVIGIDSFIKDRTDSDYANWEIMDFARLEKEVLQPFLQGKNPIRYGHFDWNENKVTETKEIKHSGYIIIEGVGLFRPELLKYFTYKIWVDFPAVDCPAEEGIARGKKRDRDIYHNPQDESWGGVWKKNDKEYVKNFHPKESTDIIIKNY